MLANLQKTWGLLSRRQRYTLVALLAMMVASAIMDTLGIGLLMPFIGLVVDPTLIYRSGFLRAISSVLPTSNYPQVLTLLGAILIIVLIIKSLAQFIIIYIQGRVLVSLQLDIEKRLMTSFMKQNYLYFTKHSPSELFQTIRNANGVITLVLTPTLSAISETALASSILIFMIYLQPLFTLAMVLAFALLVGGIYLFTRSRSALYGILAHKNSVLMNKWMYQSFEGIKDIKISSKEDYFSERSMHFSQMLADIGLRSSLLSQIPRPLVEVVVMVALVSCVLGAVSWKITGSDLLPFLVLLAAASLRLMPSVVRVSNATISIRQATYHVSHTFEQLVIADQMPSFPASTNSGTVKPVSQIEFSEVAFQYEGRDEPAVERLSFKIARGQSVAFVGPSGAGKTTAVDLLLGLVQPDSGKIRINGIVVESLDRPDWRGRFGYVPQTIYLADDTVAANIAFGEATIDRQRLAEAVKLARLDALVSQMPNGLDTEVGDRGVRLSGGQRQRIGIARALYRKPEILVLDEATSALDTELEREIVDAIERLHGDLTIVLVAHRLTTVERCDRIYFMEEGRVRADGSYLELMSHPRFSEFAGSSGLEDQPSAGAK